MAIILWSGAICTLAIYSLLYKENPYYRLFEHIFIGLATGQGVYITWTELLQPRWWEPMVHKGQWWWIFALVAGMMFYFIYSKRNSWVSRFIFGALMGLSAGLAFQSFANIYIPMVRGSFKPVIPAPGVPVTMAINNLIFVGVLVTVMSYFFFSIDHRSASMRRTASLGRWLLMFAFGAMFGSTVMGRMSLFIGRFDFLVTDWRPIVPSWFWIALGVVVLACIGYLLQRPRPPKKLVAQTEDEVSAETVPEAEREE